MQILATLKHFLILSLITFAFGNLNAQNYYEDFQEYSSSGDTAKQKQLLEDWQRESPNDAELYTCLFNFYFLKSRTEILQLSSETPEEGNEAIQLVDDEDQVAGFISGKINYDESNLKKAFESIDEGIKRHPNRLDMRFGKIYVLGEIGDWNSFTSEIIKTVNYSTENKNQWTWTLNQKREGGEEFFLSSLQDYQMKLYNTGKESLLGNMREISEAVLNHYPNHVQSLSNSAITYLILGEFEKALIPLKKAEEIAPEDFIVLNNIAYCYKNLDQKDNAIKYYKKVIKFGDERAVTQAENEIEKLKN